MKLLTLFLFVACLHVSAGGFSQSITLQVKNLPLVKVFAVIKNQTGYTFNYTKENLRYTKPVTLDVKNGSLTEVLDLCFKDQPVTYQVEGNYILIKRKPTTINAEPTSIENTPSNDIKGRVVNEKAEPVEAVTVTVKGTTKRTSTDSNGEFSLPGVEANAILIFTGVTIEAFEYKLNGQAEFSVQLKTKINTLGEVTVQLNTGYQEIPKERVTGSFTSIDNTTLNKQIGTNILDRLNGVTSGVFFDNKSVTPNRQLNINVRGLSTINGNQDPLIVLDNFPFEGNLTNINPNDIESVTILKDAAAASIWGTRAGNGVIVITTKKGKINQPLKIELNSTITITNKPDLYYLPQMESSDYIDVEQMLFKNGAYDNAISSFGRPALSPAVNIFLKARNGTLSPADSLKEINALKHVDIRDQYNKYFYQKATTQQYNLSLRGGSGNMAWLVSGSFDKSIGTLSDQWQRINAHIENTYKPTKNLQISLGLLYTNTKTESGKGGYGSVNVGGSPVPYLSFTNDIGQPIPVDINYNGAYTDTAGALKLLNWKYYPLEEYKHNTTKNSLQELITNIGIQYKVYKDLTVDFRYQYQRQTTESKNLQDLESYSTRNLINQFSQVNYSTGIVKYNLPLGSILGLSNTKVESNNIRGQLNFNKNWGNHSLSSIAGGEIRQTAVAGSSNTIYGYNDNTLTVSNIDFINAYPNFITGAPQYIGNGLSFSQTTNRYVSVFANAAYTYKHKYTISGSIRKDASNLFGVNTNDKWKPFWSLGGAYDLSNESFYNLLWLPYLKLRATYGVSGNVDQTKSAVTVLRFYSANLYTNFPYASVSQFNNPDLKWEKVSTLNFGADFGFKNQFLSGSIEYYIKKGLDLFGPEKIDYTAGLGINQLVRNVADMKSSGLDLSLHTQNINRTFKWYTDLLFNYNLSKTTRYFTPTVISSSYYISNGNSINPIVGMPLYSVTSYKWAGLDHNTGNPQGYLNGKISTEYGNILNQPFSSKDSQNYVINGSATPKYFGSIGNTFVYKNFSVSVNFIYKLGYYFKKNSINYNALFITGAGHNDFSKRWQQPGDEIITNVPSLIYPNIDNRDAFYSLSEVNVLKGDHIRLQFINLAYELNKRTISRLPIQSITLYLNASNLGVVWKANHEGLDPDVSNNSYPQPKSFAVGLKALF